MTSAVFGSVPLAARVEAAERRLMQGFGQAAVDLGHPGAFVRPFADGLAVSGGPSSPITKVMGLRFAGIVDAASLAALEADYDAVGAPVVFEVATLADLEWVRVLERRGYRLQRTELVLGRALGGSLEVAPLPEGVEIAETSDHATWSDVSVEGFAASEAPEGRDHAAEVHEREAIRQAATLLSAMPETRGYLATRSGVPAGAASLRLDADGIAQCCGATTLLAHRRRGIQTALLQYRLAAAAAAGCDLAVVVTEPGSRSQANVERHGFHPLYSRLVLARDRDA